MTTTERKQPIPPHTLIKKIDWAVAEIWNYCRENRHSLNSDIGHRIIKQHLDNATQECFRKVDILTSENLGLRAALRKALKERDAARSERDAARAKAK